jgi:hypothetical protein
VLPRNPTFHYSLAQLSCSYLLPWISLDALLYCITFVVLLPNVLCDHCAIAEVES